MDRVTEDRDLRLRLVEARPLGYRIDQLLVFALQFLLGQLRPLLRAVLACTTTLMLAGCEGPLSAVDPAGPAARTVARLWWVMLADGTGILVFV